MGERLSGRVGTNELIFTADSPVKIYWKDTLPGGAQGLYKLEDQEIHLLAGYARLDPAWSDSRMIETLLHEIGHVAAICLLPHSKKHLFQTFQYLARHSHLAKFRKRLFDQKQRDHLCLINRPGNATSDDLKESERQLRYIEYLAKESEGQADALAWFFTRQETSLQREIEDDIKGASAAFHVDLNFQQPKDIEITRDFLLISRILIRVFRPLGWSKGPWRRTHGDR